MICSFLTSLQPASDGLQHKSDVPLIGTWILRSHLHTSDVLQSEQEVQRLVQADQLERPRRVKASNGILRASRGVPFETTTSTNHVGRPFRSAERDAMHCAPNASARIPHRTCTDSYKNCMLQETKAQNFVTLEVVAVHRANHFLPNRDVAIVPQSWYCGHQPVSVERN